MATSNTVRVRDPCQTERYTSGWRHTTRRPAARFRLAPTDRMSLTWIAHRRALQEGVGVLRLAEPRRAVRPHRVARFPNLDHPSTPLLVDTQRRRLAAHQMRCLIERLCTRAGIRARIPPGAMVHALRHSFAADALQAGADIVELQSLLDHASLDTTRRYLDASAKGLREVIKGHPSQIALREHLREP